MCHARNNSHVGGLPIVMSPQDLRDRPQSAGDPLSEVLRLVEVSGAISGGFAIGGAWTSSYRLTMPLKFAAVVRGGVWMQADGVAPVRVDAGDIVVLNHRRELTMTSTREGAFPVEFQHSEANTFVTVDDHAERDVVLGGHIDVNDVGRQLLSTALPPLLHVRASAPDASHLHGLIDQVYDEVIADRIGADFAITQLAQLLVLSILRTYLKDTESLPPSWLALLSDSRLRPAVAAMHADPGNRWCLADLARTAAMSRTSFAERFRALAGVPPLTYLGTLRMLLAQRALRDPDVRVGVLAAQLGYTSDSAFSNAFKREVGMSPLRYRAGLGQDGCHSSSSAAATSSGMSTLV